MKPGEKVIIWVSAVFLLMAVLGGYMASSRHKGEPPRDLYLASPLADQGLKIMRRKGCNACHLYLKGGEYGVAPVLEGEGTKRGIDWIRKYINDPKTVLPKTRHDGLWTTDFQKDWTQQDREAVAVFLGALRANPGSANYPEPPQAKH